MIGIIGGTGFEKLIKDGSYYELDTPYGHVRYIQGNVNGYKVIFIPRHGFKHEKPPHRVSYKANIYALYSNYVDRVIGISAVGSLREDLYPGSIVIPSQFIDYTCRRDTFYDEKAIHVDVSKPYCRSIAKIILEIARENNITVRYGLTYITTEGPRFETPAEIRAFKMVGADIVGMTNVPEVVLAREAGIHYLLISIVTNYAAGIQNIISEEEVYEVTKKAEDMLYKLIEKAIEKISNSKLDDYCTYPRKYFEERGV